MNKNKIAVLTDSCSDIPTSLVEKYDIYVLPLKVIFKDREYLDGVDITPLEVYESMAIEIPKTSLASGKEITDLLDKIKADGYEKVIAVTISSGLSGTNNFVNLIASNYEGLDVKVVDTKNIGIGSGFIALQAARYVEEGLDLDEIYERLNNKIKNSKVFFVVKTLEYLHKGGRIGLVASLFGNALNLKPIISCNDEGIYYTVAKVRGRRQSLSKTVELALQFAQKNNFQIVLCHGNALDEVLEIKKQILEAWPQLKDILVSQISPALGVHTGPGLIGIGVYNLD